MYEVKQLTLPYYHSKRFGRGSYIEIMLFMRSKKLELTGCPIEILLFIEIEKLELTGGHIEIMLFIEVEN